MKLEYGRGRPSLPEDQKRVPVTIRLAPEVAAWLKSRDRQSRIVEEALRPLMKYPAPEKGD